MLDADDARREATQLAVDRERRHLVHPHADGEGRPRPAEEQRGGADEQSDAGGRVAVDGELDRERRGDRGHLTREQQRESGSGAPCIDLEGKRGEEGKSPHVLARDAVPNLRRRRPSGIARGLEVEHRGVPAASGEELVVRTRLHDASALDHDDAISAPHGREPV